MFRITLFFCVAVLSCLAREIPKLKFGIPQRKPIPSPIIYKFEALITVENAQKTTASDEQDRYVESPSISSYNEPTSLQWFLRFYPMGRKDLHRRESFAVVPYVKNIPIGVKEVLVNSGQIKIKNKNYHGREIKYFSSRNIQPNGSDISLEDFAQEGDWYKLKEKRVDEARDVGLNLTFYFEAEISYIYDTVTVNMSENIYAEMAQEAIEELHLFQNGRIESDVTLTAGNKRMNCHRSVLMKRLPLLRHIFENASFDGTLDLSSKINGQELEDFVQFLYTGKAKNFPGTCYKLYPLAKKYRSEELMNQCEKVLILLIDDENSKELFLYGQQQGATELLKAAACKIASLKC